NTKHAENVFAPLNWGALLLNGLMWLAIYVTLRKGAESIGKIIIPTITIPLVLLFILFFTAINLDGSSAGLSYYLSPDWSKMDSWQEVIKVAQGAYGQIFFSLSIGFGTMVAYASFLPKKADINNSAMIAGLTNSGVEFFGGFITFSVLGFLALNNGVFVSDAVEGGFGLALVSYPTTISQLPFDVTGQALIGLAFFGSLFLLGYTSAFSLVEPMVIGIVDKFGLSRVAVLRIFCLFGWVVGIIFCTPGGFTLLDTVDHYLNSYGLLGVGLMQCILVGWVYGPKKLRDHLNHVSERRATWFWDFCIKFFTPTVLILLLSLNAIDDLRFLWSDEGQLYSNYTGQTQLIGVGAFALTIVAAVFFAQRKTNKQGYHDIPEFDYGSK
ncbi:MAG: hypothetical protein L6Q71_03160, partial [Planctomycetes bacterium]|nr:hypothetical protein [Planctomycetota bacterium]